MKRILRRGAVWIGLYVAAVLLPMAIALLGWQPPGRGFLVELAVGFGFIGLAMMGLQFILTARFRWIARTIGMDNILHFHRQAGIVATVFVFGHVILIVAANPDYFEFFNPAVNFMRAVSLTLALVGLVLIIGLSVWRKQIRLEYEWWRLSHGVLSALVLLVALAHVIMVDDLLADNWKKGVMILLVVIALGLLIQTRVVKPLIALRRPWKVDELRKEIDRVWTLVLSPDGHAGFRFKPGQCVWLTIGSSPFSVQQHPFTISSSADEAPRIELAVKELGDFTATIGETKSGTRAYLEGPYGAATLDTESDEPAVFIVGGIGITPAMSMLRTMRARGARTRPCKLLFGVSSPDRIIFREELNELTRELNLEVVYVLTDPPDDWEGETGYLTKDLLERHLQDRFAPENVLAFVCGPEPMMDMVESALGELGVPMGRINSERFNLV